MDEATRSETSVVVVHHAPTRASVLGCGGLVFLSIAVLAALARLNGPLPGDCVIELFYDAPPGAPALESVEVNWGPEIKKVGPIDPGRSRRLLLKPDAAPELSVSYHRADGTNDKASKKRAQKREDNVAVRVVINEKGSIEIQKRAQLPSFLLQDLLLLHIDRWTSFGN